jgi:hypothetical protein
MLNLLLPSLLLLAQDSSAAPSPAPAPAAQAAPAPAAAPAQAPSTPDLKPLSFFSQRFKFQWDKLMLLSADVDGLKINSIYFQYRTMSLFKGSNLGTRSVIQVTNLADADRYPGFAVAVFDADNRLLGVASGGPKLGGVHPKETEEFSMDFTKVLERVPKADHFYLAVELKN